MEFHPVVESKTESPAQLDCPDGIMRGDWRIGLRDRIAKQKLRNASARSSAASALTAPLLLTDQQLDAFVDTGILVVRREDIWTDDEVRLLVTSTSSMDDWADTPGKWMKYFEKERDAEGRKVIARIENFAQYNPGLDYFLNGQKLLGLSSQLLGEDAVLYKEKINYKLPGGAGFNPHQDVAAGWWLYNQSIHISTLVAIDEATIANGCLEVVYCQHDKGMLSAPWKELEPNVYEKLEFKYVETRPGDVVFFDSYVPHRSAPNNTKTPRRVLYATYAKKSEGDYRARYYRDKRQSYPPDCERIPGKTYEYKV